MPTVNLLNEEAISMLSVRAELPEEAKFITNTVKKEEAWRERKNKEAEVLANPISTSRVSVVGKDIGVSVSLCHTLTFPSSAQEEEVEYSTSQETKGETKGEVNAVAKPQQTPLPFVGVSIVGVSVNLDMETMEDVTMIQGGLQVQQVAGLLHCATPEARTEHQLILLSSESHGAATVQFQDAGNGEAASLKVDVGLLDFDVDLTKIAVALGIYATNIQPEIDNAITSINNTISDASELKLAGTEEEEEEEGKSGKKKTKEELEEEKKKKLEEERKRKLKEAKRLREAKEEKQEEEIVASPQPGFNVHSTFAGVRIHLVASHSSDALTIRAENLELITNGVGREVMDEDGQIVAGSMPPLELTLADISIKGMSDVPLLYRSSGITFPDASTTTTTTTDITTNTDATTPFFRLALSSRECSPGSRYETISSVNCEIQGIVVDFVPGVILNISDILQDREVVQIQRYLKLLTNRDAVANATNSAVAAAAEQDNIQDEQKEEKKPPPATGNNTCLRLRVRVDTVRAILRAAHPTFDGAATASSPVIVVALRETGVTGTITSESIEEGGPELIRVSTQSAYGVNVHGFGTTFYPSGAFLHGGDGGESIARGGKPVDMIEHTPLNISFSQKVHDLHAEQFAMQQVRTNLTSQIGSLILLISPIEVTFLLVLAKAYVKEEQKSDSTGGGSGGGGSGGSGGGGGNDDDDDDDGQDPEDSNELTEEDSTLLLLDVVEDHCETMERDQRQAKRKRDALLKKSKAKAARVAAREAAAGRGRRPRVEDHHFYDDDVHAGTLEEIAEEIDRDGPLGASASLLGLSLHVGVDQILFTLLVAPQGVSISRPCLKMRVSDMRVGGGNKSLDAPWSAEGGMTLRIHHYDAKHSFWQPILEEVSFHTSTNVPMLAKDVDDIMQTKVSISASDLLQLNVTIPLLQDLVALGSYSDDLDRDGSGQLDVDDLAGAIEEAGFLPYEVRNRTGVELEFWFPGDDIVRKGEKMVVASNGRRRFDVPDDRKNLLNLQPDGATIGGSQHHEVHVKLRNNTRTLQNLPIDVVGYHVQRLRPVKRVEGWETAPTAYLDWNVTLERGVRIIRIQSLVSVENWTTEILEIRVSRRTKEAAVCMEEIITAHKASRENFDDDDYEGSGTRKNPTDVFAVVPSGESQKEEVGEAKVAAGAGAAAAAADNDGFGIFSIEPGKIFHVPLSSAPRCTIHVRPKADEPELDEGDDDDDDDDDENFEMEWSYLSNAFPNPSYNPKELDRRDRVASSVGIHLHDTVYDKHQDFCVVCDCEKRENESKLDQTSLGCMFILRADTDPLYSQYGQVSLQLYPVATIQNLLTKPMSVTLHKEGGDPTLA